MPSEARAGQLRLSREGPTLRYLVADGPGQDYRQLYQTEFGTEDIELLRLVANTGEPPAGVDVRLVDLRIRSSPPAAGGTADEAPAQKSRWKLWLAATILGLILTLSLGVWLYARRRPTGKAPTHAPGEGEPAKSPAIPSHVSFPCPDCGKQLKARRELGGRKVKCPQCGRAVPVPEASGSPGTSS
jgi:hypothetical protein